MELNSLIQDHTMAKIVRCLQECKLTDEVIENLKCSPEDCSSRSDKVIANVKCSHEEVCSKSDEEMDEGTGKQNKKRKLKQNRSGKKAALTYLRWHRNILKGKNFYDERNIVTSMPKTPSFSIMHSLKDGFSIVMYSGSHRVNLSSRLCLHRDNAVRIILPEWMMIIWHESLFHASTRSRFNRHGSDKEDLRFFSYVWPENDRKNSLRTKGTMDGVSRENGEEVYRNDITEKICRDMYRTHPSCIDCKKSETTIDLTDIPPNSYSPGDYIIGG